ncbi:MAG: beta-N-acetylhexosaminidase [Robiginitomaculum sp.]
MGPRAVIFGCSGPKLSRAEAVFFRDVDPWAFILFARNIETPEQVRRLCADLRSCVGRDALIFIDQEGGRVQRLRPPHFRKAPSAQVFGALYGSDKAAGKRAIWLNHRLIAAELRGVGVTANCAPVLDIPVSGADPIISDRAFSIRPEAVIDMAQAAMAGLMSGGVAPVIKHIPGHGRATVDSHKALPVITEDAAVLAVTDYKPFIALNDAPMAMTAHVIVNSVDPKTPVTLSAHAMKTLVRGTLGYQGLVMSDDLDMKALSGELETLARGALSAGCDIALHCNGKMRSMAQVAKGAGMLSGMALERAIIADNIACAPDDFDTQAGLAELEQLLAGSIA